MHSTSLIQACALLATIGITSADSDPKHPIAAVGSSCGTTTVPACSPDFKLLLSCKGSVWATESSCNTGQWAGGACYGGNPTNGCYTPKGIQVLGHTDQGANYLVESVYPGMLYADNAPKDDPANYEAMKFKFMNDLQAPKGVEKIADALQITNGFSGLFVDSWKAAVGMKSLVSGTGVAKPAVTSIVPAPRV